MNSKSLPKFLQKKEKVEIGKKFKIKSVRTKLRSGSRLRQLFGYDKNKTKKNLKSTMNQFVKDLNNRIIKR